MLVRANSSSLTIDSLNAEVHNNLGVAYDDIGQTQNAIDLFKKAIEIDRNHTAAYANLSRVYFKMKQYLDSQEDVPYQVTDNLTPLICSCSKVAALCWNDAEPLP